MRFSKWHALGNSYLVVDPRDAGAITPARVQRLCDVGTGIGSDGVLEVLQRTADRVAIKIWNPDGSTAEMSGNGVRIAALWLAAETEASAVTVAVADREVLVEILPDGLARAGHGQVDVGDVEVLTVGDRGEPIELIAAAVGNPHAIVRREDLLRADLLRLGPLVEKHERFPERTNVQLVRVDGDHDLAVLVWERGAGETESSGSSSVAAAATAVRYGWCSSPVTVHLPGGQLTVEVKGRFAWLTGPAEQILVGSTDI